MSTRLLASLTVCLAVANLMLGLAAPAGDAAAASQPGATSRAAGIVYAQPPSPSGGLYQSSRNGTDFDRYVWDSFSIPAGQTFTVTEVQWRGGYASGSGGPVLDFRVAIYPSITGGSQPDVVGGPVAAYMVGGPAGETLAGTYGGVRMYDYHFTLPASFTASGPAKYWVHVEAQQGTAPDWGISAGTGGNNTHYMGMAVASDISYYIVPGDAAFTLLGAVTAQPKLYLPVIFR